MRAEARTLSHLQGHIPERFPQDGEDSDLVEYLLRPIKRVDLVSRLLSLPIQDPE